MNAELDRIVEECFDKILHAPVTDNYKPIIRAAISEALSAAQEEWDKLKAALDWWQKGNVESASRNWNIRPEASIEQERVAHKREDLSARITAYLAGGGLFNPEYADHALVQELLIECRDEFDRVVDFAVESIEPRLLAISGAESIEEALDIFKRERKANVGLATENERLREGLKWYADGNHYELEDWEDCSGESANWLFPPLDVTESPWMVDDGSIAQAILDGRAINPDRDAEEITLPAAPVIPEGSSVEPVAWMFQHDDTGLWAYLAVDGINTPETFLRDNPRYGSAIPLYSAVESIEQDARRCSWTENSNGAWETDCGHIFEFTTGTPADNHAAFCQYCGGVIAALQEKQP